MDERTAGATAAVATIGFRGEELSACRDKPKFASIYPQAGRGMLEKPTDAGKLTAVGRRESRIWRARHRDDIGEVGRERSLPAAESRTINRSSSSRARVSAELWPFIARSAASNQLVSCFALGRPSCRS